MIPMNRLDWGRGSKPSKNGASIMVAFHMDPH